MFTTHDIINKALVIFILTINIKIRMLESNEQSVSLNMYYI